MSVPRSRERSAGDSAVQREAEVEMLRGYSARLGGTLTKKRIPLPTGGCLEVDGICSKPKVLCEAWAHQGPPKPAQKFKVMADAVKLHYAARLLGGNHRPVLLFADSKAEAHFREGAATWMACALKDLGIQTETVTLPADLLQRIRDAQARQYR